MSAEQKAVNAMIERGMPFEHIEDFIDMLALTFEQQRALWLLAWAEATDSASRQQFVARILRDDRPGTVRSIVPTPLNSPPERSNG